jgi:hypothetical protein
MPEQTAVGMAAESQQEIMPIPFGVEAATGKPLPELTAEDLDRITPDPPGPRGQHHLAAADGVDTKELSSAGWGVVFGRGLDPQVKAKLKPLLDRRREQAKDLYFEFEGPAAPRPAEGVRSWLERNGASFNVVQPELGVPLYLLLVGSPVQIPFEFQFMVDSLWNVGRLDFDTPDEYGMYADSIVAYETSATVRHKKRAALWSTKNSGDRATGLLFNQVAKPLINGQGPIKPLGTRAGFQLTPFVGADATKPALMELLRGKTDPPALLFTGSHGLSFPIDDPNLRENQGALLTQEWSFGEEPVTANQYVTGAEVLADADVHGMIHFLFACYGGGCPAVDTFKKAQTKLMETPITARLPQALLKKGALAVMAHIDRAWGYSFQSSAGKGQYQGFRSVMDSILGGTRIGQATDGFNSRWAVLAAELQELTNNRSGGVIPVSDEVVANRWVARNDARNYLILGDPAVRLRVEDMQA